MEEVPSSPEVEVKEREGSPENARSEDQLAQKAAPAAFAEDAPASVGVSPKKKRRVVPGESAAPGKKAESIVQCNTLSEVVEQEQRAMVTVQGFLVHVSAVKITKEEPKKVVSFVVADRGLAVQVSLWTPIAEKYGDKIAQWYDEAETFAYVRVVGVQAVQLAQCPKVLVKLHSCKKTSLELLPKTGEFGELQMQPDTKHLIHRFDASIASPGLSVNLIGIVAHAGEMTLSKDAQRPMRIANW